MRNIIKIAMSALLALGFAYAARSQACGGVNNMIPDKLTSSALGRENRVYGRSSTAIGVENIVSTSGSTDQAFAIGYKNYATANLTFAFGDQNTVSRTNSFAFGQQNTVSHTNSFAFGSNNVISDQKSMALGFSNKITKNSSFVIGGDNEIENGVSVAIGYKIKNTARNSITIGYGYNSSDKRLLNNTDGIMMGMNSDKPTLFISRSFCDGRTGRVGIGNVTEPQAKLHVKADNYSYDGEDADIMLEPTRSDKKAAVYFRNKNNSISVSGNNKMYFNAGEYNFANGAIHAEEVVVEIMRDWPDYVFNDDYQLTSLNEVKKYIDDNGHLPGMPSTGQVSEEGVKLGEINTKLLEKIEELTLYIIRQEERIQALENQLDSITKN